MLVSASDDGLVSVFDFSGHIDEDDSWRAALNLPGAVGRMGFYGGAAGGGGDRLWMASQLAGLHLWKWRAACREDAPGELREKVGTTVHWRRHQRLPTATASLVHQTASRRRSCCAAEFIRIHPSMRLEHIRLAVHLSEVVFWLCRRRGHAGRHPRCAGAAGSCRRCRRRGIPASFLRLPARLPLGRGWPAAAAGGGRQQWRHGAVPGARVGRRQRRGGLPTSGRLDGWQPHRGGVDNLTTPQNGRHPDFFIISSGSAPCCAMSQSTHESPQLHLHVRPSGVQTEVCALQYPRRSSEA